MGEFDQVVRHTSQEQHNHSNHSGTSISAPGYGVHSHEDDHDHNQPHTHEIDGTNSAPSDTSDGTGATGGDIGAITNKNDQHDKEITDTEGGILTTLQRMLYQARTYGPTMHTAGTGSGGFSVTMNPSTETLNIDLLCKYNFFNGLTMGIGGLLFVNPSGYASKDAILQQAATTANTTLDIAGRAAFLQQFTWTADEITDGITAMNENFQIASDLWSYQHSFFIDKEGWRDLRARVNVNITGSQGATVGGTDHLNIVNIKTPPAYSGSAAAVGGTTNVSNNASNMYMDDDKLAGLNSTNFLHRQVTFATGKSTIDNAQKTFLRRLITTHKDDNATLLADGNAANDSVDNGVLNSFKLIGHCSTSGSASSNTKLAQERIDSVKTYLTDQGLDHASSRIESENKGEDGATADESWQRVDIIIGSGEAQHTFSHEFGHVFGLGDEYATGAGSLIGGTGSPAGTQVRHDALSTSLGADNATAENNDGIMSLGNEVRQQHYATFGHALRTVTNIPEWKFVN